MRARVPNNVPTIISSSSKKFSRRTLIFFSSWMFLLIWYFHDYYQVWEETFHFNPKAPLPMLWAHISWHLNICPFHISLPTSYFPFFDLIIKEDKKKNLLKTMRRTLKRMGEDGPWRFSFFEIYTQFQGYLHFPPLYHFQTFCPSLPPINISRYIFFSCEGDLFPTQFIRSFLFPRRERLLKSFHWGKYNC